MIKVIIPKSRVLPLYPKTKTMIDKFDKSRFLVVESEGLYIYENRNEFICPAKYSHHLFIDSDVWTEEDPNCVVDKLLARGKNIVGASYPFRGDLNCHCAFTLNRGIGSPIPLTKKGLVPCWSVGAGFLLVSSSVFAAIAKPYFRHINTLTSQTSEDTGFCMHAAKYLHKTYLDADVRLNHFTGKIIIKDIEWVD